MSDRQRIVTVTRVKSGEEPVDRSWLEQTPEARIEAVWQLTLECMAWMPGEREPRLQRDVVRVIRGRR